MTFKSLSPNEELQELLDITVGHLRQQNKKALDKTLRCVFHTKEGLKCAIGAHIPDDMYNPRMEFCNIYELVEDSPILETLLAFKTKENMHFMMKLQRIHDRYSVDEWETQFNIFASEYNLKLRPKEMDE